MNGSAPFCRSRDVGWDVTASYEGAHIDQLLKGKAVSLDVSSLYDASSDCNDGESGVQACNGPEYQVRWWWPTVLLYHQKIQIPTAHILGKSDEWEVQSKQLADLCAPDSRMLLRHEGSHEIPLRGPTVEQMAEVIVKTSERGEFMA